MRSGEMLRQVEQMLAASQNDAVAISREVDRRMRLLNALRTVIEAGDDLAKAGYALVPLEPTEGMLAAAYESVWGFNPDYAPIGPSATGEGSATEIAAGVWRAMVAAAAEPDDPP